MNEWEKDEPLGQRHGTDKRIEYSGAGSLDTVGSASASFATLILLLFVSIMLPLVNLSKPELGSPHEARVVATGHNMAETGDWVVPYFNGAVRLQKPPLPYWTIAALVKVFGPLNEGLFRLPSALMGIGGVILTLLIAGVMFGWKRGLVSALILSLTLKYLIESRLARVDIYLTFWVLVSLFFLSVIFFGKQRRDWLWPFVWGAIAMGFLAKWIIVFIFVGPPMLYGLWAYPERRARVRWHLLGLCVFSALAASWLVLLVNRVGWETVRGGWVREFGDNVTANHKFGHNVLYYIPQLFVLSFPWSALVPVALSVPFLSRSKPERSKLLWIGSVIFVALVAFSLIGKKKADYLLPALPLMTILAAKAWEILTDEIAPRQRGERGKNARGALGSSQAVIFILAGVAALFYCFLDTELKRYATLLVSSFSLATAGILAIFFIRRGKGWPAIVSLFFGAAVFSYAFFGLFLASEARTSSADFGRSVSETIGESPLVYFGARDDTLVYHLHRTIPSIYELEPLQHQVKEHPETFVLVQGKHLDTVRKIAENIVLHNPRFRDVSLPLPGMEDEAIDIYLLCHSGSDKPTREFTSLSPEPPVWLSIKNLWLAFGFLAQAMFFGRFLLQWIASEMKKKSVVPIGFWWLSLAGGIMLLSYAVYRKDPVFIIGQGGGILIYLRNLYFIYVRRSQEESQAD